MTPPTTKKAGFPLGTPASWSNSTFLERYDLSGKTSELFATSGWAADGLRNSVAADAAIIKGGVSRGHASEAGLSVLAEMA